MGYGSFVVCFLMIFSLTTISNLSGQTPIYVEASNNKLATRKLDSSPSGNGCILRCYFDARNSAKTRFLNKQISRRKQYETMPCYRKCTESKEKRRKHQQEETETISRHKRSASAADMTFDRHGSYQCPFNDKGDKIGSITNVSLVFKQQHNDTNNTWTAYVTWDVNYLNSSGYSGWGFLILWSDVKRFAGRPKTGQTNCRFNYKNTTWRTIKSGESDWVYPNAINIFIVLYPSQGDDEEIQMKNFDPKALAETTSSTDFSKSRSTIKPSTLILSTDFSRGRSTDKTSTTNTSIKAMASTTGKPQSVTRYFVIAAGILLGILLVGVVLIFLYKRQKKSTESCPEKDGYEYDTSILYSSQDKKWVTTELMPLLEKKHNFKCFVHYRNWQAGRVLHENMADSVYKCRKVVAVVSKHFLQSNYCKEELHMALERVQRCRDSSLIVINLDGTSKELLPNALRCRTFVDLMSPLEKKTWKSRLVRQISQEDKSDLFKNQQPTSKTNTLVSVTKVDNTKTHTNVVCRENSTESIV